MTTEIVELAAGDIDHSGISTSNTQPIVEQAAPAEMTADQQVGVQRLAEMRQRYADPGLDAQQRETLMARMSELSRHIWLGAKKPAWHGEQKPDARFTDQSEHDPFAEMNAEASATLTPAEHANLIQHAKVQGLDAQTATLAADFAQAAGLDRVTGKVAADRFIKHQLEGWGIGTLSPEDEAELQVECVRAFGSEEKAVETSQLARAYIESVGLTDWVAKNAGSLRYDPGLLGVLAYKARCLGLAPKE